MQENIIYIFTNKLCQPCKYLKRTLAKHLIQYEIKYIDIDENLELAAKNKIKTLPTSILNNKRVEGNVSFDIWKAKLEID
jgi:glutaredoxin